MRDSGLLTRSVEVIVDLLYLLTPGKEGRFVS